MATRKIFGATLIALLLASLAYMFYGTAPRMWELLTTASPMETAQMVVVLILCGIILAGRVIVAVVSRIESGQ